MSLTSFLQKIGINNEDKKEFHIDSQVKLDGTTNVGCESLNSPSVDRVKLSPLKKSPSPPRVEKGILTKTSSGLRSVDTTYESEMSLSLPCNTKGYLLAPLPSVNTPGSGSHSGREKEDIFDSSKEDGLGSRFDSNEEHGNGSGTATDVLDNINAIVSTLSLDNQEHGRMDNEFVDKSDPLQNMFQSTSMLPLTSSKVFSGEVSSGTNSPNTGVKIEGYKKTGENNGVESTLLSPSIGKDAAFGRNSESLALTQLHEKKTPEKSLSSPNNSNHNSFNSYSNNSQNAAPSGNYDEFFCNMNSNVSVPSNKAKSYVDPNGNDAVKEGASGLGNRAALMGGSTLKSQSYIDSSSLPVDDGNNTTGMNGENGTVPLSKLAMKLRQQQQQQQQQQQMPLLHNSSNKMIQNQSMGSAMHPSQLHNNEQVSRSMYMPQGKLESRYLLGESNQLVQDNYANTSGYNQSNSRHLYNQLGMQYNSNLPNANNQLHTQPMSHYNAHIPNHNQASSGYTRENVLPSLHSHAVRPQYVNSVGNGGASMSVAQDPGSHTQQPMGVYQQQHSDDYRIGSGSSKHQINQVILQANSQFQGQAKAYSNGMLGVQNYRQGAVLGQRVGYPAQVHGTPYQSQIAPLIQSNDIGTVVYQVHFKMTHAYCCYPSEAGGSPAFELNDFVIVEADRGLALGLVVAMIPVEQFKSLHVMWGIKELKEIKWAATAADRMQLAKKAQDEEEALQLCYEKAIHVYKFPITLIDAEFQFDRQKLTFVFKSKVRVDFREMVRDLFAIYETRIWMSQMDVLPIYNTSAKQAILTGVAPLHDISQDWTTGYESVNPMEGRMQYQGPGGGSVGGYNNHLHKNKAHSTKAPSSIDEAYFKMAHNVNRGAQVNSIPNPNLQPILNNARSILSMNADRGYAKNDPSEYDRKPQMHIVGNYNQHMHSVGHTMNSDFAYGNGEY